MERSSRFSDNWWVSPRLWCFPGPRLSALGSTVHNSEFKSSKSNMELRENPPQVSDTFPCKRRARRGAFFFFWSRFIVPRRFSPMLHITIYGGWWIGGGMGGGVIIVVKRTRPILLGSFWSRPETNPFRTFSLPLSAPSYGSCVGHRV